ncbi:PREDICTED: uncharacterized protein LOC106100988 isoform X2 [Papilio polytes]|uniref:uncharacterized protein LOC106100988 isoform X2 n=1 Tax=Papilio polytes TaxID=76194 RepID=UPI000676ACBB|nr:PREDICTED: uncharacterized protein LOC106100988 isoform X2 [Papilio polytes]
MAKPFAFLVIFINLATLKGENALIISNDNIENLRKTDEGRNYAFSYGVADEQTGDIKNVWDSKDGDIVKGQYSVLDADGSVRTVEYTASPDASVNAAANNDGIKSQKEKHVMEDKSYRDFNGPYDLSEDPNYEFHYTKHRKNKVRPYDLFKDFPMKRPSHTHSQADSGEFRYNPTLKHYYNGEPYRTTGYGHDPDCDTKYATEGSNYFKTISDLDFRRQKYPLLYSDPYTQEKYKDIPYDDSEKYLSYKYRGENKSPRPEEMSLATSVKYNYPMLPDIPVSQHFYRDDVEQRPKKKHRPPKPTDVFYSSENFNDYVMVPKKKYKKPPRLPDINDYSNDNDEDYDPLDEEDDRKRKPFRGSGQKEVVRKIIKKPKPTLITLLDILDI